MEQRRGAQVAVILQADIFKAHAWVTVLPVTHQLLEEPLYRVTIEPTPKNGLERAGQMVLAKIASIPRKSIQKKLGRVDAKVMRSATRGLAVLLGFGKSYSRWGRTENLRRLIGRARQVVNRRKRGSLIKLARLNPGQHRKKQRWRQARGLSCMR
jgi:mRNA interferase MazF